MSIRSQTALVVAPRYFGYEQEIVDELRRQGTAVDLLPDRPFESPFLKAAIRVRPELTHPASDRFFERQLDALSRREYGLILVIQGESVTARTLRRIRSAFPRARMVFYTWDSLENKPFARSNLDQFDHCLTFDPVDAKRYGMRFRPLFFAPGFERAPRSEFSYDISFVGTVHSDRYSVVKRIADSLPPSTRTHWFLYIQAPWLYWGRRLFTDALASSSRREFSFEPTSKSTVQQIFFESKAVVDVEHPKQRGLTMRTIETIGSGTKLVTTNAAVRDYDFYNATNICVVDRSRPAVDPDFLDTPYAPIADDAYNRYRLSTWVAEVSGTAAGAKSNFRTALDTVLHGKDFRASAVDAKPTSKRTSPSRLRIAVAGHKEGTLRGLHRPLLQALRDAGCRPVMIGRRDGTVEDLVLDGFDFIEFEAAATSFKAVPRVAVLMALRRVLKRGRFDMVFTFGAQCNVLFALAAVGLQFSRVPTVPCAVSQGNGGRLASPWLAPIRRRLERWSLRSAPWVVLQSADAGTARADVGALLGVLNQQHSSDPTFLFVGDLEQSTGVTELIAAARRLKESVPGSLVRLAGRIGTSPAEVLTASLVTEAVALGLVELHGAPEDVRQAIAAADCVVIPSASAAMLTVLLQAAAMSRPCIAADLPALRGLVEAGVDGQFFEAGNGDSLAAALVQFCGMPQSRRIAMGLQARARQEAAALGTQLDAYVDLVLKVGVDKATVRAAHAR